jgi:DNA-binding NarL/FixJ family response regulator
MSGTEVPVKQTVVIADDHEIVRQSLANALAEPGVINAVGMQVVDQVEDGFAALAAVKRHKPDLLLLDVSMPLASGTEVIKDIQRWSPNTRTVVFTGIEASGLLWSLVEDGAQGLFSKADPVDELLEKLPMILEGTPYIAPRFKKLLDKQQAITELTSRERQTLTMVVGGMTNREMAEAMNISPKTVDKHRTSMMNKLNLHSVVELIAFALREGILDQSQGS